jgi:hypothetical protein
MNSYPVFSVSADAPHILQPVDSPEASLAHTKLTCGTFLEKDPIVALSV